MKNTEKLKTFLNEIIEDKKVSEAVFKILEAKQEVLKQVDEVVDIDGLFNQITLELAIHGKPEDSQAYFQSIGASKIAESIENIIGYFTLLSLYPEKKEGLLAA